MDEKDSAARACSASEATSLQKTQTTAERVREACAKVAEDCVGDLPAFQPAGSMIAAAIRSLPIGGE